MGKPSSTGIRCGRYLARACGWAFEGGSNFQAGFAFIGGRPENTEPLLCGDYRRWTKSMPWNCEITAPLPAHVVVRNDLALSDAHAERIGRFETQESRGFP